MARRIMVARSAKTGQFVKPSYAKRHPNTTEIERYKVRETHKPKKGK